MESDVSLKNRIRNKVRRKLTVVKKGLKDSKECKMKMGRQYREDGLKQRDIQNNTLDTRTCHRRIETRDKLERSTYLKGKKEDILEKPGKEKKILREKEDLGYRSKPEKRWKEARILREKRRYLKETREKRKDILREKRRSWIQIETREKMERSTYLKGKKEDRHLGYRSKLEKRWKEALILQVVLFGCETWTLTLREEHRLRVFENKVLRKIFGAKRDEVKGEWRKLHNTELHALYSSPDIIRNIKSRRLRMAGHVTHNMCESRNANRVLVGKPEKKKTFEKAETEALRNATEPVHSGFDLNEAAKMFGVLKATLASRSKYPVEGKVFFGPRPVLGEAICNNIREMTHTCF
ncbi:hypothetical protein ANN_25052 [Periplaneta americana]|uniref:Uncharacterized protein n=1 Tax=Periplaneta americana TaxID=6978 RepID=A0ABQ8S0N4_PERAM|nr:hypothetical protein ANN_25052 [Periplaneta americana]